MFYPTLYEILVEHISGWLFCSSDICVRKNVGYCCIQYTPCTLSGTTDGFGIDEKMSDTANAKVDTDCAKVTLVSPFLLLRPPRPQSQSYISKSTSEVQCRFQDYIQISGGSSTCSALATDSKTKFCGGSLNTQTDAMKSIPICGE